TTTGLPDPIGTRAIDDTLTPIVAQSSVEASLIIMLTAPLLELCVEEVVPHAAVKNSIAVTVRPSVERETRLFILFSPRETLWPLRNFSTLQKQRHGLQNPRGELRRQLTPTSLK